MPLIYIHTTFPTSVLLKQFPGEEPSMGDFDFTFGAKPSRKADGIIVHRFLAQSFKTHLPKEKVAFICGEPPEIHTYPKLFADQFGLIVSPYKIETDSAIRLTNYRCVWYAGMSMNIETMWNTRRNSDFFRTYRPESKMDKIAVIRTRKTFTDFHRLRDDFISLLKSKYPDRVDVFGSNGVSVDDKFDVLKDYKYTLAAENTNTPSCWSEKLSDPLLSWTLPLYIGPAAESIDLPQDSFIPIDVRNPFEEIERIDRIITDDTWSHRLSAIQNARNEILNEKNIANLFFETAQQLIPTSQRTTLGAPSAVKKPRIIFCEKIFDKKVNRFHRILLTATIKLFPSIQAAHHNI